MGYDFARPLVPDIPLHVQIREQLRSAIEDGVLESGQQMPTEPAIAEMYGVSRMTTRQALAALVAEGIIYKVHGRGTFVTRPKIDRGLVKLRSFYEEMSESGRTIETTLLLAEEGLPSPTARTALQLDQGQSISMLKRLRLIDGSPMAVHINHVPVSILPDLVDAAPHMDSLYQMLERAGHKIVRGVQHLEAVSAPQDVAELLEILPGAAVLRQETVSLAIDNTPLEMSFGWYRGDRYSVTVELTR